MADFERWLDVYGRLYDDPSPLADTPCPSCGVREGLRLIYQAGGSDPATVLATFWCDHCLVGMLPLQAPTPSRGEIVPRDACEVPNYRLVVPR